MSNPIIEKTVDGRKLKSYGLKIGDRIDTDFGEGKVIGMKIVKSNVDSFDFNKGEIRHMVQVLLSNYDGPILSQNTEVVGQEFSVLMTTIAVSNKMLNQIQIDKIGIKNAVAWGIVKSAWDYEASI